MTLRPPQPPQSSRPLDAEERALAKSLPRLHGRTAPGPDLDAGILAAAQAAVRPAKPSLFVTRPFVARPRIRWIAPASLAASMLLAFGMAWQLRPLPTLEAVQPAAQSDSADMAEVQMIEPVPRDMSARAVHTKPVAVQSAEAERQLAASPVVNSQARSPAPDAQVLETPAPLPPPPLQASSPPPAPPAPPAPAIAADAPLSVGASAKSSTASSGNTLDMQALDTQMGNRAMRARTAPTAASSRDPMEQEAAPTSADKAVALDRIPLPTPKAATSAPVMPELRNEARKAADAGFVDDPDEDVPPATVDSPAVRSAWLYRIGELLDQGKRQEAKASLTEFKRRYPAVVLPPRLRTLESEP